MLGCEGQLYLDSASLPETVDIPLRGGSEACLIQQRRMQQVSRGANFLQRLICQCSNLGHHVG